ncbi:MAG: preprotein translocase subunit SecE [Acidimicrobiales bacterium]
MNRQTKRSLQRQGETVPDGSTAGPGGAPATTRRPLPSGGRGAGARSDSGSAPGHAAPAQSVPERTGEFVREVRNELVKVAWPGRPEVINYAVVVFVTLVLLTAIIFGLDYGFAKAILVLFQK